LGLAERSQLAALSLFQEAVDGETVTVEVAHHVLETLEALL
jgi:hypothetical protein